MDAGADSFRRYLSGDDDAFIEIMDMYRMGLIFFINRFVGDYHAAEDISMECFVYLLVHKHRYNFKVTLKTYLFMIGRSRALDYIKHRKIISTEDLSHHTDIPGDEDELSEILLTDERKRTVNGAIAVLPRDMRSVIHLIYFEDMTYKEAARVMKKTPKQVDNLLYRAKKELRSILGENGGLAL